VRQWAPTAFYAIVSVVPTGALLGALGVAGAGYLTYRADIAAAGVGTAVVGLAVERLQNRTVRRRARRERRQWRAEREQLRESVAELRRRLADAQQTLSRLAPRPQTVCAAVDGVPAAAPRPDQDRRPEALATASPLPANPLVRRPVTAAPPINRPVPPEPQRRRPLVTLARSAGAAGTAGTQGWRSAERPAPPAAERPAPPAAGMPAPPAAETSAPPVEGAGQPADQPPDTLLTNAADPAGPVHVIGNLLPSLPPGPRDPVSGPLAVVSDLSAVQRQPDSPSSRSAATVDAMVWAAMAEAEADEMTLTLERLDDPDRGGRHTGASVDESRPSGLVVVGASVVGDPACRTRHGRHTA
jgi:hypothetical protein